MFVTFFVFALLSCANDCEHLSSFEVDLANGVIVGVAEVNEVIFVAEDVAKTLRVVKTNFFKSTIY